MRILHTFFFFSNDQIILVNASSSRYKMSVYNKNSVAGLYLCIFFLSLTSFNQQTVCAVDGDAEFQKYGQSLLMQRLRDPVVLRRLRRGLTDLDPGNRATETPQTTTTSGPPPPSVNPAYLTSTPATISKPTTAAPTQAPTTKNTNIKIPKIPVDFWKNFWKRFKKPAIFNPFG